MTTSKPFVGRKKILCDEPVIHMGNIKSVLQDALSVHLINQGEIDYLYNYYKGKQPILNREKRIRKEINNKIVENRAHEIVSFKTGYLCGEPIQYISRGDKKELSEDIGDLNDMMMMCGKAQKDKLLAEWMYIAGIGARMVIPNDKYIENEVVPKLRTGRTDFLKDEAPFDLYVFDPRYAFVVYYSGPGEPPVLGVKITQRQDNRYIISAYSETDYFEFESQGLWNLQLVRAAKRTFGGIPIIEYPLNNARQSPIEVVLPILDAINRVQSNRLDGIEQFIQSLLVLVNAEVKDEDARYIQEAGLIVLKSLGGENRADIKIIAEQLDQMQTQRLIDYMHQTILDIVGMPNRNGKYSTSDTGAAVYQRDGHSDAEARAKSDELMFKESERQLLKIILNILRTTVGTRLTLADIEIKFTRRIYENSLAKAQIFDILSRNPHIAPSLAFAVSGLFSDPEDAAKLSEEYYEKYKREQRELAKQGELMREGGDVFD